MAYQTSVQNSKTIRFGSAKIEGGETVDSLINVGLAAGVEFTEDSEPRIIKPDNGPEFEIGRINHTATVKFEMWEFNLSNIYMLRGGGDVLTTVAGEATSVTNEAHTLTGVESVRLNNKNGDGSIVSSIVVTDASGNAAVQNTDYVISVDPEGFTTIARVAASTVITSGEGVLVDYSYTPAEAYKFTTGGKDSAVSPRVIRLTNTNSDGKVFRITLYAAKNQKGIELKLPGDDSADNLKPSMELKATKDITRVAGDQLYEIYDEQGVL